MKTQADLFKHIQYQFLSFHKKENTFEKTEGDMTYTLNITIFKLSTAEVNTLKKKKNIFFCQENINHNASLKKRLLAFF